MTPELEKMLRQEQNSGLERQSGTGVEVTQFLAGLPALLPASRVIWASYLWSILQFAHLYNGHDTSINPIGLLGRVM